MQDDVGNRPFALNFVLFFYVLCYYLHEHNLQLSATAKSLSPYFTHLNPHRRHATPAPAPPYISDQLLFFIPPYSPSER
ncbi:hypothetical protein N7537_011835 [Penicillium hordei]|uniref:Uncharacterized protein n=1 Tax=Penicillium hordei TaxID=40994 RepID=A0AAD6GTX5_9EURO|nr:uncharacterized protein N7537_011835 [Penicillium hordei]KAJ5589157.1 hypothetical protein N7537_011835 [Penicillium hordei]